MYLNIGGDVLIAIKDIIAIIDKKSIEASTNREDFLYHQANSPSEKQRTDKRMKSVIVTTERIYYSPLAAGTLKKRATKLSL